MPHSPDQQKERVLSLAKIESVIQGYHHYLKGIYMLGNGHESNPLITPISLPIKDLMRCGNMNVTRIKELLQFTKGQGIQELSLETLLCTTKPNSPGFDEDNDASLHKPRIFPPSTPSVANEDKDQGAEMGNKDHLDEEEEDNQEQNKKASEDEDKDKDKDKDLDEDKDKDKDNDDNKDKDNDDNKDKEEEEEEDEIDEI
ncbi:hypothetical protein DFH28DRAFT_939925 [Melampsora americana]|nr:hypothetical protein DFH28DRAFT_939925 [Melampsora americana]